MTEANDPGPATEHGRRYHDLLLQAVNVLTDAARLTWTVTALDGQVVSGRADWAEFVSLALAGAAANMDGIKAILAGRPGSWEADYLRNLLTSTVGYDEQYLLEHRTEPVVVELYVEQILTEQGAWQPYADAQEELDRRYEAIGLPAGSHDESATGPDAASPEQDQRAEVLEALEERLEQQRQRDWADYGRALTANIETAAARRADLRVPVIVTVDLDTFPRLESHDAVEWGIAEHLRTEAINATPLPGANRSPLDRLRQAAVTARTPTPRRNQMTCVGPLLRSHPSELARSRSGRAHQGVPSWIMTDLHGHPPVSRGPKGFESPRGETAGKKSR